MKHLKLFILLAVMMIAGSTFAQTKIAYLNIDEIVGIMPEFQKVDIDTIGTKFVQDSIVPQFEKLQADLEAKGAQLQDTVKNSVAVRKMIWDEYFQIKQQLDNAQNVYQQVMQNKQNQFLAPLYEKARKGIEAVAKEKGYTHVMPRNSFYVAPPGDDITLAVANKLGLKIPQQPNPSAGGVPKVIK